MFLHRDRAKQLIDFDGIQVLGMRPTDLDGVMDIKDKAYIFFEMKHNNAPLPFGQQLLLQRLVDRCSDEGRPCIALIASHDVDNTDDDVIAKDCIVRKYYWSKDHSWHTPKETYRVGQLITRYCKNILGE